MELAKYKACICEGSAEEAIIEDVYKRQHDAQHIFIQTVIQENKAIPLNHPVHSLQGTKIFAKHDIDTKLPCNFKRVSGTAAFTLYKLLRWHLRLIRCQRTYRSLR